jgi:hypothetical protein
LYLKTTGALLPVKRKHFTRRIEKISKNSRLAFVVVDLLAHIFLASWARINLINYHLPRANGWKRVVDVSFGHYDSHKFGGTYPRSISDHNRGNRKAKHFLDNVIESSQHFLFVILLLPDDCRFSIDLLDLI